MQLSDKAYTYLKWITMVLINGSDPGGNNAVRGTVCDLGIPLRIRGGEDISRLLCIFGGNTWDQHSILLQG